MQRYRWLIASLSLCLFGFFLPGNAWAQAYLPMFDSEREAQQRCPSDTVVWIKSQAAMQSYKGQPPQKGGGYVCRQEAVNTGYGGLVTHLQPLPKPPR